MLAGAHRRAVIIAWEEMLLKQRINLFEDITTAEVIHTVDLRLEILPEITQQRLPFKLAVRNPRRGLLQPGSEAVFDITGEETQGRRKQYGRGLRG